MPVRDEAEVREALEAQAADNSAASELLDVLRWSSAGNAAQKRARLATFLDGPPSRRRVGWLDLVLRVHAAGATSFDDLEPDELEADGAEYDADDDDDIRLPVGSVSCLVNLVERMPRDALAAPAAGVLPDITRTVGDDGRTCFTTPANLPSSAELSGQEGASVALQQQVARLEKLVESADERAAQKLRDDIRDGKISLPSDASVASQRAAFAFDFDPDRVVLLGTERDEHGDRIMLAGPREDDPDLSKPLGANEFEQLLFYSPISKKEVDAINRRNLLPTEAFCDAPELEAEDVALIGGTEGFQYKAFETLRVRQQSLLKPVQCHFRALAAGSEVFLRLRSVVDELPDTVADEIHNELANCQHFAEELIAAESV